VEEVDGEHAGGLGAQELPPAGVGVPLAAENDVTAPEQRLRNQPTAAVA
jgi:hypothetical protein